MATNRLPALLLEGGLPPITAPGVAEGDSNLRTVFAVHVECILCGHIMLFNSERYRTGDEEILIRGLTEAEEDDLELS
jgi:hypothetical protein